METHSLVAGVCIVFLIGWLVYDDYQQYRNKKKK